MVAFVVVGALHYFTQKYMDKRMGHVVKPMEVEKAEENPADSAPLWYAVLPVIPLSLILSFSSLWITTIKMNIVMAMFIGLFIGAAANLHAGATQKSICRYPDLLRWPRHADGQRNYPYYCRPDLRTGPALHGHYRQPY